MSVTPVINIIVTNARGKDGLTGPGGTLTNNSGAVITGQTGDSYANPRKGLVVTSGAGATDVAIEVTPADGSLAALSLRAASTGRQVRYFRRDGLEEGYIDSGAFLTAKYVGIYAGIAEDNGLPTSHPAYMVTLYPPSQLSHMLGIHADVQLVSVVRGYNGAKPMAQLYMLHDGYGYRLDMCDGTIRFSRPDQRPLIGDKNSTSPMHDGDIVPETHFPLAIAPTNAGGLYGVILRSDDTADIGQGWYFIQANGGICGHDGSPLLQWESGAVCRIGTSTKQTVLNGQSVSSEKPLRVPGYTVSTLPSPGAHPFGQAIATDASGGACPIWSDGTNWRRYSNNAVVS